MRCLLIYVQSDASAFWVISRACRNSCRGMATRSAAFLAARGYPEVDGDGSTVRAAIMCDSIGAPQSFTSDSARTAEQDQELVADELATQVDEDRRSAGQARAVLLAAAGRRAFEPQAVRRHAAQDLGAAAAKRVALTGRGATVFGSKRFRKEQCRPERRSARSINVCERMDEPWRQKSDLDAGEWEPPENRGWFAARIVAVKQKYGLSVNPDERDALQAMLNSAPSRTVSCGDGLTSGGPTYYFPHLAVGASWQTTITYINYSPQEVTCQTDFLSDHGTPLMVSFEDRGTVPSRTDVLPPGGSVHQETDVALSAPLAPGWALANCTGPVQASLLFRGYNSEGMPVAEAGVNAATVPATRFVTFAEQGEGKNGTGVAYANPSDTAALVTFTARDADGEVLAIEDLMLPPNGHGAQNMPTLFDLSSFTGSLEVTSAEPIVSLSLNFEAASGFSSLPPGELDAAAQGSTTYYFPHLAVGASWQTTITYINYSREEVTCQTDFISDHGSPLMVSFAELGMVDSRTDVLPPGGSVHQETNVDLSAPLAPGWARATCTGPVQASLLFRGYNSEGMPVAEAGVNAATVPATRFVTFAEQGEGKNGTGVAYANPSDTAALVTFTARDADGEVLAIEDLMLPPNWHGAQNMPTLFDLSSFTGSLEVTSTEPIVSLSLNFEAAPVFSSLPPGELDAAAQ